MIRTVGFLKKLSTIDDVMKYRGNPVSRYTGIAVFLETVYYRQAFLNTMHPYSELRKVLFLAQSVLCFWATVCKTVRPMLLVRCLSVLSCLVPSVLSVTFVHCGQTVGRIKMKLGMQVRLGPGHIVLGGDPAHPPLKGHSPPIFGPYLLRPVSEGLG